MERGIIFGLRALGAVLLVTLSVLLVRRHRSSASGLLAFGLCFGLLGYLGAQTWGRTSGLASAWLLIAAVNPALIWLLARTLFCDDAGHVRLGVTSIVAAFGLTALTQIFALVGFSGFGVAPQFAGILDSLMPQLVSVYLLGFALVETRRGANQDLLEPRRQLRTWLVAFMVGYGVLVLLFEVALRGAPPPWQLELVHQSLLAGLIGVALYFVQRHGVLLLDPHRLPAVVTPAELNVAADRESVPHAALEGPGNDRSGVVDPSQNEALLQSRLAQWELAGGFLEPGLTIASLASRLGTQEYLLRRLLNGRLGFRNFNDFLHRLRIAEACRRLRGPDASALPILTLSIELGYSSLATFNRAFKSIVGVSPTEYRNTPQFRN